MGAPRLASEQVWEIRRLGLVEGGYTQMELARRFGVGQQHISRILRFLRHTPSSSQCDRPRCPSCKSLMMLRRTDPLGNLEHICPRCCGTLA